MLVDLYHLFLASRARDNGYNQPGAAELVLWTAFTKTRDARRSLASRRSRCCGWIRGGGTEMQLRVGRSRDEAARDERRSGDSARAFSRSAMNRAKAGPT